MTCRRSGKTSGGALFVAAEDTGFYNYGHHFIENTARFPAQHPHCRIGIRDELGENMP